MMACPDPAGSFESQFLAALQKSTKWSVSAGTLDLRDDGGAQQVAAQTAIK
jgi:heat shock protein HslJ